MACSLLRIRININKLSFVKCCSPLLIFCEKVSFSALKQPDFLVLALEGGNKDNNFQIFFLYSVTLTVSFWTTSSLLLLGLIVIVQFCSVIAIKLQKDISTWICGKRALPDPHRHHPRASWRLSNSMTLRPIYLAHKHVQTVIRYP